MTIWKKSCQISTRKLKIQLTLVPALFQGYFPSKFTKSNNEIYTHTHIYIYTHIYMYIYILKKEMATHSSLLAWRIPWTEEPGE